MKKTKKRIALYGALSVAVIGSLGMYAACKNTSKELSYSFNENLNAELNVAYDPQIEVGEGTKIVSVEVYDANGIFLDTVENYSFTPDGIGEYYYRVVFQNNGENTEINKTIVVRDTVAPTITQAITQPISVELGSYNGFEQVMAGILVDDNDSKTIEQITKKAVAITHGTTIQENVEGYDKYLFTDVGEYTVKVAVSDVSGNVAYTEYKLNVTDTTAPILQGKTLYYAWRDESGKVALPTIKVNELSTYSLNVTAEKNGESLTVSDNKTLATVGDEISLTYTAIDEHQNNAEFKTTLKVLEKGVFFDLQDSEVVTLFTADGAVEQKDGKVILYRDQSSDMLSWQEESYGFGSAQNYSAIVLTLENYAVSETKLLLSATQNGEKIYVGGTTLIPTSGTATTCIFDITKFNLDEVSGWQLEAQSGGNIYFALSEARLIPFVNDYFTVDGLKTQYKVGESLQFNEIQCKNDAIREYSFSVNGSQSYGAGERYTFTAAGVYTITFSVDVGNKIFNADYTVTVEDSSATINLSGGFITGKVGVEYVIPTATLSGQTLQTEVKRNGETVALKNGKFTPVIGGKYTVAYTLNGEVIDVYTFAVEEKNSIDFENVNAFDFSTTYGDVSQNRDQAYVTNGLNSVKMQLSANGKAGFVWNTPITLTEDAKFVTADIYANVAGTAKLQLLIGNTLTPYESGAITLSRGNNEIVFPLPANLKDKAVYGVLVYNYNKYDNIFFLDNVRLIGEWSLTNVFATSNPIYTAEQGGEFIFPKLTSCDANFLKEVTVSVNGNGLTQPIMFTQNATFAITSAIATGEYTVTYKAIDIFDRTHETSFVLSVGKSSLSGTLKLGTYYVGEEIELAQVSLESSVYTNEQLQNATVTKYYRPENGLRWELVPQTLRIENTGTYQFRYVITVEKSKVMLEADTYIHSPDVHIDFEKYAGGDHMYYSGDTSYSSPLMLAPSDYWSHDGKYSCKMFGRIGWEWENGVRMSNNENLFFDYPIDTVVFYGYSDYDLSPTYMFIGHSGNKSKGNVDIDRGEHKYVVHMDIEDNGLSRIGYFGFKIWTNNTFYIDDLYFTRAADVRFEDVNGNNYIAGNSIAFTQPTIAQYDDKIFTEGDVANASYTIEITPNGGKKTAYTFADGEAEITLPSGEYTVRYVVQIGAKTYESEQQISVRAFEADFITPDVVYDAGVAYQLNMVDGLAEGATLEAYAQIEGGEEWKELPVADGVVTLNLAESGRYKLKYVAKIGEQVEERIYTVDIRHQDVFFDFELQENGLHHGINNATVQRNYELNDAWSKNGKYSLEIASVSGEPGSAGIIFNDGGITLNGEYRYVGMWIKVNLNPLSGLQLTIKQADDSYVRSAPLNIPVGEGYYLFEMEKEFSSVIQFGFNLHYAFRQCFNIDMVQAYKAFEVTSLPSGVNQNTSLTIEVPKVDGKPCEYATSVKYLQAGEQEYTKVEMKDGKYTFALTKEGMATVLLEIEINGGVYTYEYHIIVRGIVEDPYVDDMPWISKRI